MQTLRHLHERNCYYVDKTGHVTRLVDEGTHYFLSRPRRFGKSLLLDTLKELFEGNEALFTGLHIHDRWDWSERHPVVRLSFGGGHFAEPGYVQTSAMAQLAAAAEDAGVAAQHDTGPERFRDLLRALHARTGPARGGAGGRVRQADPGRAGGAGHCARRTATTCGACTLSSRTATLTYASPSSPESAGFRR